MFYLKFLWSLKFWTLRQVGKFFWQNAIICTIKSEFEGGSHRFVISKESFHNLYPIQGISDDQSAIPAHLTILKHPIIYALLVNLDLRLTPNPFWQPVKVLPNVHFRAKTYRFFVKLEYLLSQLLWRVLFFFFFIKLLELLFAFPAILFEIGWEELLAVVLVRVEHGQVESVQSFACLSQLRMNLLEQI